MRKFLFCLVLLSAITAQAQQYNNEWIDYNKTYYKFKVGKNGLFRIPQSVLATVGLGNTPAEHFQLWRNGKQIPIYTSVATGSLSPADYIEFWGEMNDGKADKDLYRNADFQLNDKWSLETDTAAYFLTLNTASANLRLANTVNNVAGNSLPKEPYFMHTVGMYFKDKINNGYAVNVGEYLYSSSYDRGEGWTSNDIAGNAANTLAYNDLNVYTGGPKSVFKIGVSGNAINPRNYRVSVNGNTVAQYPVDYFGIARSVDSFNTEILNTNAATVEVRNLSTAPNDRMVIHQYEMTYPRQFNFGNTTNFEFSLPRSTSGNYLEITGFNYGSSAPVLLDVTNGKRYVADIGAAPVIKVVLEPSATERRLILVNATNSNFSTIDGLQVRNFANYTAVANQGDFIIITNPALFNGPNGTNPVEDYKNYRSSNAGGNHNAKIYVIDELVDQFGFGIKKHPNSIRNFLRYARQKYNVEPKNAFIIGKGVNYLHQRSNENHPDIEKLNLVPTFGWPASDILLSAEPGSSVPEIPIGRISAISGQEVAIYLKKIKDFEAAQANMSPNIEDRGWMKNVVHIVGASEPGLQAILDQYMNNYKRTISDTLYGAKVSTFTKTSSDAVEQLSSSHLQNLFQEGISLITYFGHSSASTLEFNLDNPENYNNQGKYPMFLGLGCNAGNFFNFNTARLITKETLSERWVFSQDRGTIGFIASTHFGIVHYLDIWNSRFYKHLSLEDYGKPIGDLMKKTIENVFSFTTQEDFYARSNSEQTELHGDPSIILNTHKKADYVINDPMVKVNPNFISVAESSFKVQTKIVNIGKSVGDSVLLEIKRQYPNGTTAVVASKKLPAIRYSDSVTFEIPIDPIADKGLNKITVTIDADQIIDEYYETNNSVTKEFTIYEDEVRPIYPYNLSIVNKQNIKLLASPANPFSAAINYRLEIDTTEKFNSPIKVTQNQSNVSGIAEFNPGLTFTDGTVYYWRVGIVPNNGPINWNTASFVYLANSEMGFNQSHLYQHTKSTPLKMTFDQNTGEWRYSDQVTNLFIRIATFAVSAQQQADISVAVNGDAYLRTTCHWSSLVFNVFDPMTLKPWENQTLQNPNGTYPQGLGLYESLSSNCLGSQRHNFEFRYTDTSSRRKIMDFMTKVIPDGAIVIVRNFTLPPWYTTYPTAWAKDWMADTAIHGSNKSIYHYLKNQGLQTIDSFYTVRPFALVYKKGDPSFAPRSLMGEGMNDKLTMSLDFDHPDTLGYLTSPQFGPASKWKELKWDGVQKETATGDIPSINVIGIRTNGAVDTLIRNINVTQKTVDVSSINAEEYPYLQLRMRNADKVHHTPYQLKYWRLTYDPVPEGAVAPGNFFQMKDTLIEVGEPIDFKMAFKNIANVPFDSLKVKMVITDRNNVSHVLPVLKHRPLGTSPDTLHITYKIDTRQFVGKNTLYVEVNPDNDQPEQHKFNNLIYKDFYVVGDTLNPLLDVTFDNVHILNHDIVSSKPDIMIRLKDEAKWMLLDDTSLVDIQIRFPNGDVRKYKFDNDTLSFSPAQKAPNAENTATISLKPYFTQDGEYELMVTGKDKSDNKAGSMQYKVAFQVINKAMISNLLNYPNPFTTSTAFVFTLTGTEIPQNMKIQIMTVTGKIVREITKDELGPIHIGRNITEFKWDGTDQYGQKLANGVYLYRVVTNLNGKSLEKYKAEGDETDKYFNNGYGKMYLMR